MLTRILVVQPVFSVIVDESGEPADTNTACGQCAAEPVGACGQCAAEPVGANGAILTALAGLLQKAITQLPTILPEILQLIALFGGQVSPAPAPANTTATT